MASVATMRTGDRCRRTTAGRSYDGRKYSTRRATPPREVVEGGDLGPSPCSSPVRLRYQSPSPHSSVITRHELLWGVGVARLGAALVEVREKCPCLVRG